MKVIVAYMSLSGNTEKIAEAIFEEIQEEKEIKKFEEVESLEGYDLAFLGFPMHGFGVPEDAEPFLKNRCKEKRIALFITHGAPEHYEGLKPWLSKFNEAAAGANIIGMFNCQGELADYVAEALLKSDNPRYRAYGEAADTTKGQPDAVRVERARVFAREVMEKINA
jgi:flavodoxin